MRGFLVILGLMLYMITTRADELPVIKDSEAVRYAGKKVEVRGMVVSVTTSPLGTAFINFGRDYPNQTFAGFVPASSKMAADRRLTMLPGKTISISGIVEINQGRPEIEIVSADQIKGLGSEPPQ